MTRALHRLLRRLLPTDFRRLYGADMEEVFVTSMRAARLRGLGALLALWVREAANLLRTGRALRKERRGATSPGRGSAADRTSPLASGDLRPDGGEAVGRSERAKGGGAGMGLLDDFRYSIRSLVRRPSVTVFAALTLALGVGATTAMFSTVEAVVLNPLPYENGDRMAGIFRQVGTRQVFFTPRVEDFEAWSDHADLFDAVEPWSFRGMTLTGAGDAREIQAALVRPSFFDLIGRRPTFGRVFDEREMVGDGERVVLVSDGFWRRELGGTPEALGTTLSLDGERWTIIGVMPPRTLLPGWGLQAVEVWRPLPAIEPSGTIQVLAVLREGVAIEAVNERLAAAGPTDDPVRSTGFARLVRDQVGSSVRDYLGLLMGAVVLLLLIACVNVANLLIFRADSRRRETAVRAALGGGRARLTRQLLVESLLLAVVGGALGVLVSYAGRAAILGLRPSGLDVLDHVAINGRVLLFALGVTLGTGLLFGLAPALQTGRADALTPLRTGMRSEGDLVGSRLRWVLVSGEVALSFALLIGSLAVLATLVERQGADRGFEADEVLVMQVNAPEWRYASSEERTQLFDAILARLSALPGVVRASRASGMPPNVGILFGTVQVEGSDPTEGTSVLHGPLVDTAYFATLGQRIVRGRGFTFDDLGSEEPLLVLGETTASSFFADRDPVGARLRVADDGDWYRVVGVARDVPMTGLSAAAAPLQVYHPLRESWSSAAFVVRLSATADPAETLARMRETASSSDPDLRVDRLTDAEGLMRDTLDRERFTTTIMATFAALALLLASVGLYGVVSQVVGQRTREIGIRIALGAGRGSIAGMVLGRAGGATGAGIAAGALLAAAGTRLLGSRVHGLESGSALTYVLAATALGLTALLAAYSPARRATGVDPVEAMRIE